MKANITILVLSLFLSVAIATSPPKLGCPERGCAGPLRFYEEMGCKPVKVNPDDCCAQRYDCDHLDARCGQKCHLGDKEYNPGEKPIAEEGNCLPECTCIKPDGENAQWTCASILLPESPPAGCYRPRNASMCFDGAEVCPPNPDDIAKCNVGGNVLQDGDFFEPETDPDLGCWCGPGYEGKNVAPFCKDMRKQSCAYELHHVWELENDCAPVWNVGQDPRLHCHFMWRCQKDGDVVVPREQTMGVPENDTPDPENMTCKIGNLTLRRGDALDQKSTDTLPCIKCICDIPPVASCLHLPDDACHIGDIRLDDSHEKETQQ